MKRRFRTHVKYVEVNYDYTEPEVYCTLIADIPVRSVKGLRDMLDKYNVVSRIDKNVCNGNLIVGEEYIDLLCDADERIDVIRFKIVEKATCSKSDTYDPVIGQRIALTRAQRRVFRIAKTIYATIAKAYEDEYVKYFNILASNCDAVSKNTHNHLNELCK